MAIKNHVAKGLKYPEPNKINRKSTKTMILRPGETDQHCLPDMR